MTSNRITPYTAPLAFLRRNPSTPHTTPVRFGRDTIFERNNALHDRLKQEARYSAQEKPQDVFTATHGRVYRRSKLQKALEEAQANYMTLAADPKVSSVEKGLAGIKLANMKLAADDNNEASFELLKQSINLLEQRGFGFLSGFAPADYIHGLYNRGCYALNNVLYQYSTDFYGPEEMADSASSFEGLTLYGPTDTDEANALITRIEEGLPFLNRAITLSANMQDQKIAYVEYQSAKGEAMHALSHLSENANDQAIFNKQALLAFDNAVKALKFIEPKDYTPQHAELWDKLSEVKIPHLCSDGHVAKDDKEFAIALLKSVGQHLAADILKQELFPAS